MSDSDNDDGPGLQGILWGNLGEGDRLDLDYMPQDAVGALGAVTNKTDLVAALRREVDDGPGGAGSSAGSPDSAAKGRGAVQYIDEPTLSEDLEDDEFPVLRPVAAPAAARPMQLAAAAYGQRVIGEDDYDEDEEPAAAAAQPLPAQQFQQQQQTAALQMPGAAALQQHHALLQQLQPGSQLYNLQMQQLAGAPAQAASTAIPAAHEQQQQLAVKRPQLTPEQERLRALNQATPAQEAQQEALWFRYLDLDQLGEDIVHFSELYVPTDNQMKHAYLTSFARVPPSDKHQHDQPWERARQRADALLNRHYQAKALQPPGAEADVVDDETDKFHRGDIAVAAAEGNVVQLGLANMKLEVVEELSDAEEELFASDPQGLGRAMLQAARLNAARAAAKAAVAAAKAAQAKAAATAGDADAAAEAAAEAADNAAASASLQGLTSGMEGLELKGLVVNPHAVESLQAEILPDWEQDVVWGSAAAGPAVGPIASSLPGAGTALGTLQLQPVSQIMQPPQQQQHLGPGSMLPPGSSMQAPLGLPGMSSALPGLPPAGTSTGLPPAHTGLPGAFSAVLPGSSSARPGGSLGAESLLTQGAAARNSVGQFSTMQSQQAADAAALAAPSIPAGAAALAAADGAAAGEGAREQGKGGKGKRNKGPRIGKQKKPLEAALADLKLHRHMLRLMPSIAAAAATQAAAEAAEAAATAAAAAAASGDRAAAAALWGGSAAAAAIDAACAAAAEAQDQLKLRHVGDLLQLDMKPVLPEDDDWLNDIVWDAQEAAAAAAAGAAASGALRQQQLAGSVSSLAPGFEQAGLGEQQQALSVRQPGGGSAVGRAAVLWDLNDPYMVFEAHSTQPYANASAMMHPVPAQAAAAVPPHLQNEKDPLLRQLAPLHISRDYLYQASERTSGRAMTTGRHSSLAINLITVPLFPKDGLTAWWHRPRSWWSAAHLLYCMEEARRLRDAEWGRDPDAMPENGQYTYEPVGLNLRKGKTGATEGGGSNFEGIWSFIANQKAYKDAFALEPPRMKSFGPEYNFAADDDRWMGAWLTKPDETTKSKSVAELGFRRGINWIIPVWTKVAPLRTREVAVLLPPNVPCRPPAALKTIKSLSAVTAGHMLLLEYLEERPLMVLQTGMGMRLTTYYRRKNDSDMHYQALQAEYSEGLLARQALPLTSADRLEARPPWMVGTPQVLTPDDPSPFYELAPIPNGEMQFAVDTPCFRAPAVPHVAAATDFLLARLPAGNIALRELTGCVAVGQQHPSVTIWQPGSEQAIAYERARFKVWVVRTLRHRADLPNVKAGKAIPTVSLQEMQAQNAFLNMSFGRDVNEIARMLRDECQCMPVADKPGHWTFVPNAKLPSDQDLKKMVTPDMAVQYEALIAGLGQRQQYALSETGLADTIQQQLADVGSGPLTTLRLVLDMLFPDAAGRQAAAAIEQCVLNTPWAQSQAYQSALVQDAVRNPAALTLVGRGDPTGRGRGFSFVREDPKRAKEEAAPPPGVTAQADGTITGTGADLRRLSNKRAGEILETKFGMDPSVVQSIARWDRIDMIRTNVRDPANAALVNSDPELQQWVRNVKMTAEDVKSKMRNTAAPLFAAQMNALHEPWDDGAASDDMSWGPPQQLAAAAAADAEADSVISRATEVYNEALEQAQLAQDQAAVQAARQALEAQLQQPGGLCRGNAKAITLPPNHRNPPAASRGRGQEALEGQRRIRRQITYFTANGSTVYRTVYIYSREEMAALNALYKSGDNFGQRKVATSERKFQYARQVKLGETFLPEWPVCTPELPPLPITEQEAAAAAAAGGAASTADPAYWATGAEGAAAAAAGYGGYAPQQEAVAWQQPVAAPAQPRAPKLSKKQRQQQALAAKRAAQAAAKKNKKRRRDDDFASDDESFEMSDSDDDAELAMAAEGSDDDDGSPRAKRARPARAAAAAAASGGGGEAAATAAPAAAVGFPALPAYVPPPDTTQGAADVAGLGESLMLALQQFNLYLKPACDTMIRFQASKQKMGFLKDAFYKAVPPTLLPDYSQVVPPERQMWLERIKQRLQRHYYSSRAQFEADCMMIVQAAKKYHAPAGKGGKHFNTNVAIAAENVVNEGLRVLQTPDVAVNIAYWEGRVQIEKARDQGPEAFKQFFQGALASAQVAYAQGQDQPGWHWLMCEACKQWRLVTGYCFYTKHFDQPDQPFRCSENTDWPAPSCTDAPHWSE